MFFHFFFLFYFSSNSLFIFRKFLIRCLMILFNIIIIYIFLFFFLVKFTLHNITKSTGMCCKWFSCIYLCNKLWMLKYISTLEIIKRPCILIAMNLHQLLLCYCYYITAGIVVLQYCSFCFCLFFILYTTLTICNFSSV